MSRRQAQRSKTSPAQASRRQAPTQGERLQKVLAAAGVDSRRQCELLILEGRVEVDRQVVSQLGVRVDPSKQHICVDGEPIASRKGQYYLVNKPTGVVTTNRDPQGRPRVVDLIDSNQRLFCVGRLDMSSEGLILVTNDGALANQLTHPRYGVEKTYLVEVAGRPTSVELATLIKGIRLAEGLASVERLRIKRRLKQSTQLELVLREGRNREIRRLLAKIGHKVLRLKRIALGSLKLGEIPPGAYRPLMRQEIAALRRETQHRPTRRAKPKKTAAKKEPAMAAGGRRRTILGGDPSPAPVKRKKKATRKKGPRKGRR